MLKDNEIIRKEKTLSGEEGFNAENFGNLLSNEITYIDNTIYSTVATAKTKLGNTVIIPAKFIYKNEILHYHFAGYFTGGGNLTLTVELINDGNAFEIPESNGGAHAFYADFHLFFNSNNLSSTFYMYELAYGNSGAVYSGFENLDASQEIQINAYSSLSVAGGTVYATGFRAIRDAVFNSR